MPKPERHPPSKLPSQNVISSGCYVDFEGFAPRKDEKGRSGAKRPPTLIGIWNMEQKKEFVQVVFNAKYRWAALTSDVQHEVLYKPDRKVFLTALLGSSRKRKPIFAFSEHELNVISETIGREPQTIISRYKNVRSIAKRWLRERSSDYSQPDTHDLISVAKAVGLNPPVQFRKGEMTERLRLVGEYSSTKSGWQRAPKRIREAWRELLRYNQSDVMTMHELMQYMIRNT